MRVRAMVVLTALVAVFASVSAWAKGDQAAGKEKAGACAGCHGVDGNSGNPQWPALAGQQESYIVAQLQAFKQGRRKNEMMGPMARPLSPRDMEDLAAYFSSQPVRPAAAPGTNPEGERIYHSGKGRGYVPACVGCHGVKGEGSWTVKAPALGGQHAAYVLNQLHAFRKGERSGAMGGVMVRIAADLTDKELEAVAAYVAGLRR
jgi:cytochrome c553